MAIYLDNAATTKMDESLIEVYQRFSCQNFFNPSAGYKEAIDNSKEILNAKEIILKKLGAKCGDIIFTSGATEANNLAIMGSLREGKSEYVFSVAEHPSVFNVAKHLEQMGKIVKFVHLQKNGEVDYAELEELINQNTRLVSIMYVNNETGVINDINKIAGIVKSKNPKVIFHVDGVQGFCKLPVDIDKSKIDLFSISGHKFHGPKGVGALYVKNKMALKAIVFGGGQELGLRSGTENLPAIIAMSKEIAKIDISENYKKALLLKKAFLEAINQDVVSIIKSDSPYIVSISFPGVNGETLMRVLEDDVIISTGSACSSKKSGNRVLEEMGFGIDYIKSSVRASFNAYQSLEEVKSAGETIMSKYFEILERVKWGCCY